MTKEIMKFNIIKGKEMSFAEKIIFEKLNNFGVEFYQEVTFDNCANPKTGINLI